MLLVGPGGPIVGVGEALLTCSSKDSPRRHPPGPPQRVAGADRDRTTRNRERQNHREPTETEPPRADRETEPPGADRDRTTRNQERQNHPEPRETEPPGADRDRTTRNQERQNHPEPTETEPPGTNRETEPPGADRDRTTRSRQRQNHPEPTERQNHPEPTETEPPGTNRETEPLEPTETEPPGTDREMTQARRSGQSMDGHARINLQSRGSPWLGEGPECALHSTVYKGQGAPWGRKGPTRVCSPFQPLSSGPQQPLCVQEAWSSQRTMALPPRPQDRSGTPFPPFVLPCLHSGPTGGSAPPGFTRDHFPPPPGPTPSPPTDSTPRLSTLLCQTQHVGQEPFTCQLSNARIKPREQAQRSQATSCITQHLPPTLLEAPGHQLRQHACAAPPAGPGWSIHQRPSVFTRQAHGRLGSLSAAHSPRLFPAWSMSSELQSGWGALGPQ